MQLDLRNMPTDKKIESVKNVKIFPNPTSDILNLVTSSDIKNVSVIDVLGKMINVRLHGNAIDVRSLPAGNYMITIETKDSKTTEKFIKK